MKLVVGLVNMFRLLWLLLSSGRLSVMRLVNSVIEAVLCYGLRIILVRIMVMFCSMIGVGILVMVIGGIRLSMVINVVMIVMCVRLLLVEL